MERKERLAQYVETLFKCSGFSEAFIQLEHQAERMGFESVLYTQIPKALIDAKFTVEPVYEVSDNFSPAYLSHYAEARFDRHDPVIKAVECGESDPLNWWGPVHSRYAKSTRESKEVVESARDYGIKNGITLPLMSDEQGIAGASFITSDERNFDVLWAERGQELELYTRVFHSIVTTSSSMNSHFSKPLLELLSNTELRLLIGLANGRTMAQVAVDINRGVKYLEQVMLSLRRKLSGVDSDTPPAINRNQLMYYAGLLKVLEYNDLYLHGDQDDRTAKVLIR